MKVTAEEFARLWSERLGASTDRIRSGVERVTEAPGAKAAAAQDKMRHKIVEALDSGRWAEEVKRVTLDEWKEAMIEKGVPRVRSGAEAAVPEMTAFAGALGDALDKVATKVDKMPNVTLDDNINRMVEQVRGMSKFVWKGRAR